MRRRALVIGNPGEEGDEHYCGGVLKDMQAYQAFLKSPQGGLWQDGEVKPMTRPTTRSLQGELDLLEYYDYALVVFSGHGDYVRSEGTTCLDLGAGQEIDSRKLIGVAPKQTTIFDCCRKYRVEVVLRGMLEGIERMAKALTTINPADCRRLYDERIAVCAEEPIVMWACSVNEYSNDDSEHGGVYSYALLGGARDWFEGRRQTVDTRSNYDILSVVQAHEEARARVVRRTAGKKHPQNPQIEKPRSGQYVPLAVIA